MGDFQTPSTQATFGAQKLSGFLCAFFKGIDVENVIYVVLHGYEELPERVENDIDLLVCAKDIKVFRRCVLEVAAELDWVLIKNPCRFGFETFWLTNVTTNEFVQIDVWTITHWKGIPWIDDEIMLQTRRRFGDVYVPHPVAEASYLLVKDLIGTGRIKRRYTAQITRLAKKEASAMKEFLRFGFGREVAAGLVHHAERENWESIENEHGKLSWGTFSQAFQRNPFLFAWNIYRFLWGHIASRIGSPNGFFLALIGPDGSGKTTTSNALGKHLEPVFRKRAIIHGRFGWLPDLRVYLNITRRLSGRKPLSPVPTGSNAVHDINPHNAVRCVVHALYYSLDFFLGHLTVRRFQAVGDLIVFDRYYYDWFIHASFKKTPAWLLPVLRAILPRPDLVVFLSNAPEVIHQRKPELTVEQIQEQNRKCREVISNMPYATAVSTEQSPEEVAREIGERIVEIMAKRFERDCR